MSNDCGWGPMSLILSAVLTMTYLLKFLFRRRRRRKCTVSSKAGVLHRFRRGARARDLGHSIEVTVGGQVTWRGQPTSRASRTSRWRRLSRWSTSPVQHPHDAADEPERLRSPERYRYQSGGAHPRRPLQAFL